VDASDPASLTVAQENGTKFVTRWNDTRDNGIFAAAINGRSSPYLRDGTKWMDGGGASSHSDLIPEGFHVVSLSPNGPVTASAFAYDRNLTFGG